MDLPDPSGLGVTGYLNDLAASLQTSEMGQALLGFAGTHAAACIAVPCAAAAAFFWWSHERAARQAKSFADSLGSLPVESPFEEGARLELREVIFALARSERDVLDICRGYGIALPEGVFRPDGRYRLSDALRRTRRLTVRAVDLFGAERTVDLDELCDGGASLPPLAIVPHSRLALIREYLRADAASEALRGQTVGHRLAMRLAEAGYTLRGHGRYLAVSSRFFTRHGLSFTPCPGHPELGLLAVALHADEAAGARGGIPCVDASPGAAGVRRPNTVRPADLGITDPAGPGGAASARGERAACSAMPGTLPEDVIAIVRAARREGGPGDAALTAEQLRAALIVSAASYRQYALYQQGRIDYGECLDGLGASLAEKAALVSAQALAAGAVTGMLGLNFAEPAASVASSLFGSGGDIDLGDAAELCLFIAAAGLVAYGIKKLWDTLFDPYEKLNSLLAEKYALTAGFCRSMTVDHADAIDAAMKPSPQVRACLDECAALDRLLAGRGTGPLSGHFFAEKRAMLAKFAAGSETAVAALKRHMEDTRDMVGLYGSLMDGSVDLNDAKKRFAAIRRTPQLAECIGRVDSLEALKCLAAKRSEKFATMLCDCFRLNRFEDVAALAGELRVKSGELDREIESLKEKKKL
ncbi:MAG: hypothetical protein Q4F72_09505 [Desulfovibrionaceae bacterium]|nr:hypothetical protein [Desulfovibrionaceae bacterium]